MSGTGARRSLREVLRGPRHTLLVLGGDAGARTGSAGARLIARVAADRLGDLVTGHLVVIADAPAAGFGATVLADPSLSVHGRLGAAADTMFPARPDGYVAFRGEPPDSAALDAYLGELFDKAP